MQIHNDLSGREFIDIPELPPWWETVPRRLYIHSNSRKWALIVAITWRSRTQGWSPWWGYRGFMGRHWWLVVLHPGTANRCTTGCGRRKDHRGPHR